MTDPFHPHSLLLLATPPVATALCEDSAAAITGPAVGLVLRKRIRQIEAHGFTPSHDLVDHPHGELAHGALSFLALGMALHFGADATDDEATAAASSLHEMATATWPFEGELIPCSDVVECYVNAAAMLLAEIDRMHAVHAAHLAVRP